MRTVETNIEKALPLLDPKMAISSLNSTTGIIHAAKNISNKNPGHGTLHHYGLLLTHSYECA